ncbi:MAG: hypothetical protein AABX83_01400 [Nanoarchaeota archaeon]
MKKYTFRNYIEYLKDNPKGYWFKRKLYGWGWVPVKWQGWVSILILVAFLILNGFYLASKTQPSNADFALFFASIIIYGIIIFFVCYKKGEKPKWTWGR